jgi:hypothetical protein
MVGEGLGLFLLLPKESKEGQNRLHMNDLLPSILTTDVSESKSDKL